MTLSSTTSTPPPPPPITFRQGIYRIDRIVAAKKSRIRSTTSGHSFKRRFRLGLTTTTATAAKARPHESFDKGHLASFEIARRIAAAAADLLRALKPNEEDGCCRRPESEIASYAIGPRRLSARNVHTVNIVTATCSLSGGRQEGRQGLGHNQLIHRERVRVSY